METPGCPKELRQRFADELIDSAEVIVARTVELSEAQIEDYARLGRRGDTSLGDNTRKHLLRFAASVKEGQESPGSYGLAFDLAYARASAGLPLSNIVRAFQMATHAMWDWFVDTVHDWGPDAYRGLWPLWLSYADEATRRSTEAYLAWAQGHQEERLVEERRIVSDLARGGLGQIAGHRRLLDLGLDLEHGIHVSVLVSAQAGQRVDGEVLSRVSRALRDASSRAGVRSLLVARELDVVVLHPRIPAVDALEWTSHVVRNVSPGMLSGVVSDAADTIADLSTTLQRSELDARAAPSGEIVRTGDLKLLDFAVLLLASDFDRYRPAFLDLLPQHGATSDWFETVIAWAEAGWNPRAASEALHVHTNTVYYRLSQIESKTGLDLGEPRTAVSVYLAARILQAQQWADQAEQGSSDDAPARGARPGGAARG